MLNTFFYFLNSVIGSLQIIEEGYAYPLDGDVYFAADKFPKYGQLSRRKLEDNRAGERVAIDSRKRHPADFALWKVQKTIATFTLYFFLLGDSFVGVGLWVGWGVGKHPMADGNE